MEEFPDASGPDALDAAEVRTSAPPTVTRAEAEKGRWFDVSRPVALQLLRSRHRRVLVDGPLGTGKAQPLDATVWTPQGASQMGDLAVGDLVLTPDGGTAPVLSLHPQGVQPVFRVTFSTGEAVECTADHLWTVHCAGRGWHTAPLAAIAPFVGRRRYVLPATFRFRDARWFARVDPAGEKPCQCIAIDHSDRLYLTDGFIPTHNTRLNLEKVRACCLKYAGCRWVLLRSVRKWLTHSALVTWETKVLEPGQLIPDRVRPSNRSEYRFRNGSVVVVAGLDDPQSVFSAEYDGACLVEAIEIDQDTAEKVDGRLRYGKMPYQQFLMDCNPGPPTHWLHRAFDAGWCHRLPMRHPDNPALYLADGETRTKFGREYLGRLDDLTGVNRDRLRDGKWVQAEGVVYDEWDAAVHLVEPFEVPGHWRRYWAIDFGHTNPLCWQFWAEDPDGRLHLDREIYQPGRIVADVAEWVRKTTRGEPSPEAVVTDHDPEAMAVVERALGVRCTPANKADKKGGLQPVKDRLRRAGDGKPRLTVSKAALCHLPDEGLRAAGKPTSTAGEFDGYVWNPRLAKCEEPLKENDHGMDALRYLVAYLDSGPKTDPTFYDEPLPYREPTRW